MSSNVSPKLAQLGNEFWHLKDTEAAEDLESRGWRDWLLTLFPFVFGADFSEDHAKYWTHKWNVLQKLKRNEEVSPGDLVTLIILGRGMGKSTMAEVAALMRAAIVGECYLLYVCSTDDQAREHIANIKFLIEHPDSKLADYYPALSEPREQRKGGADTWNKDTFITKSGAIFRAKGLNSSMRGLRVGTLRPNQIILDDIDDIKDSVAVAQNKLAVIKASILPVVTDNATIDFPQNLIAEHSVMNMIYTGHSDALSDRTVIGVTKAFTELNVTSDFDETGRIKHIIEPDSITSWGGFDIKKAQKFLNASGLDTFLAEYQNELNRQKAGKVIPEYNEETQVITWTDFEKVYGARVIPPHWKAKAGLDIGYSDGQFPHYSAWVFVATSAANSALPNKIFVYRSVSFRATSIDDQATAIKPMIAEKVESWQMSHERTGEMMTLRQKYGFPFSKFQYYRSEDGVAQWRHLSRPDRAKPNPFKDDEKTEEGLYRLGDCSLYYIVDDDQRFAPRDDNGQRLLREQVSTWEYVPIRLTAQGQTAQKPSKVNDDMCDALKGVLALFGPRSTPETNQEKFENKMQEKGLSRDFLESLPEQDKIALLQVRLVEENRFRQEQRKKKNRSLNPWRR
jgi:hypothetical protein